MLCTAIFKFEKPVNEEVMNEEMAASLTGSGKMESISRQARNG